MLQKHISMKLRAEEKDSFLQVLSEIVTLFSAEETTLPFETVWGWRWRNVD